MENEHIPEGCDVHRDICCSGCNRAWPWPRNLRHIYVGPDTLREPAAASQAPLPGLGKTVGISVQDHETVVPFASCLSGRPHKPAFPEKLFRTLQICKSDEAGNQRLVHEVEYSRVHGDVVYPTKPSKRLGQGVARLVTLNSWWRGLLGALSVAATMSLDLGSHAMAVILLCSDFGAVEEVVNPHFAMYGLLFSAVLSVFVPGYYSIVYAKREWRTRIRPEAEDLTRIPGYQELMWAFVALVLFVYLDIDMLVRDIVSFVHPWKRSMPYAAIKTQGCRAFLLGYSGEYEDGRAQTRTKNLVLPSRCAFQLILCIGKVALGSMLSSPALLCCGVASAAALMVTVFQMRWLLHERNQFIQDARAQEQFNAKASTGETLPTATTKTFDACPDCGRVKPPGKHMPFSNTSTFMEGDIVRLCNKIGPFCHDALAGPLGVCEAGVVIAIGPPVAATGVRVCVRPFNVKTRDKGSWWFDTHCLERAMDPSVQEANTDSELSTESPTEVKFEVEIGNNVVSLDDREALTIASDIIERRVRGDSGITDVTGYSWNYTRARGESGMSDSTLRVVKEEPEGRCLGEDQSARSEDARRAAAELEAPHSPLRLCVRTSKRHQSGPAILRRPSKPKVFTPEELFLVQARHQFAQSLAQGDASKMVDETRKLLQEVIQMKATADGRGSDDGLASEGGGGAGSDVRSNVERGEKDFSLQPAAPPNWRSRNFSEEVEMTPGEMELRAALEHLRRDSGEVRPGLAVVAEAAASWADKAALHDGEVGI